MAVVASLALAAISTLLAGCASHPGTEVRWDEVWTWTSDRDSLGLVAFLDLPDTERADRRAASADLRGRADAARSHDARVRALGRAAGLTPDDTRLWLDLAAECERVGDSERALRCVEAAQAALPRVPAADRERLEVDAALRRAMIHRDRGEWVRAHAWADSAAARLPGNRDVQLVQGLCRAAHGDAQGARNIARDIELRHFEWFEWRWILGMANASRGQWEDAYHWLRTARPVRPWSSRFWHDLATVCEHLGDAGEAARYHNDALDCLDLPPGTAVEFSAPVPVPATGETLDLPHWRAYDRLPVAGSRLGWALAAADSALGADDPARRAFWSDVASGLLSLCIRTDRAEDACRERRAVIYAEMGADELARNDLRRIVQRRGIDGLTSPLAQAWYGRQLLENERWYDAVPVLERAVAGAPGRARIWGDLGLALLMAKRHDEGEDALDTALSLDPDLAAAWYNRGLARYLNRRWDDAVADLEQARELAPDNEGILNLLRQAAQRAQMQRRESSRE